MFVYRFLCSDLCLHKFCQLQYADKRGFDQPIFFMASKRTIEKMKKKKRNAKSKIADNLEVKIIRRANRALCGLSLCRVENVSQAYFIRETKSSRDYDL